MAGGPVNEDDPLEVVVRANVLVAFPKGGNLVVTNSTVHSDKWRKVEPLLTALGQVLVVPCSKLQAHMTFFSSTLPIVFLCELDRACTENLPVDRRNRYMQYMMRERYLIFRAMLEDNFYATSSNSSGMQIEQLKEIGIEYMKIYLGLA